MSEDTESQWSPAVQTEYEQAAANYRHFTSLRRQEMMVVTIAQGAVLTMLKDHLHDFPPSCVLLILAACLVALLGLNSEWRLAGYMRACSSRAREIEKNHKMDLFRRGKRNVGDRNFPLKNRYAFSAYYASFLIAWAFIGIMRFAR